MRRTSGLIFITIFIIAMVLAGCSKSEGGNTASGSASPAQSSAAAEDSQPRDKQPLDFVELTWYMPPPTSPEKNMDNVMAEVNKYLKEKINASLTIKFIDWGSFDEKMKVMSAAGDPYDLVLTTNWINKLPLNVAKGAFVPLDDLLEQYGPHLLEKIEDKYWPAVTFQGKRFAIPNPTTYASTASFSYKKDLVDKYNFDYKNAHTLKDLEPFLEAVKKGEPGITPLLAMNLATPGMTDLNVQRDSITNFIQYDLKSGEFLTMFDDPLGKELVKTLSDFYKKGYIAKDAATKKDWTLEGKSGKYAVMPSPGAYTEDGSKATSVYGFPCYESLYAKNIVSTGSVQSTGTAISKTSKHPERAMMLLDLIYSDKKFFNLLAYGIEGQDYKVVSGHGTDNPTVETNKEVTWAIWHPWIGSLFDQWPSNWNSQEALDKMKRDNDESTISPLLGFNFDPEPVKQEVSQVQAIVDEITPVLWTGTASDTDKYLQDAKDRAVKAGLDKVVAEVKKQYEAWKAAQG